MLNLANYKTFDISRKLIFDINLYEFKVLNLFFACSSWMKNIYVHKKIKIWYTEDEPRVGIVVKPQTVNFKLWIDGSKKLYNTTAHQYVSKNMIKLILWCKIY